jgi:hypothetical protein
LRRYTARVKVGPSWQQLQLSCFSIAGVPSQ